MKVNKLFINQERLQAATSAAANVNIWLICQTRRPPVGCMLDARIGDLTPEGGPRDLQPQSRLRASAYALAFASS